MKTSFGSDYLAMLDAFPPEVAFAMGAPEPLLVVVDANVVINSARQRSRLRDPTARTSIEEIADSGLWQLVAPSFLKTEVFKKLWERGHSEAEIEQFAGPLFRRIGFVREPPASAKFGNQFDELARRDPKDLPYARLYEWTRADFVLTADADLADFCRVVRPGTGSKTDVLLDMRNFARATAEYVGKTHGAGMLGGLVWGLAKKASAEVLVGAAAIAFFVWQAASDETRAAFRRSVGDLADDFVRELASDRNAASDLKKRHESDWVLRRGLRLEDRVFRLALRKPRELDDISKRLRWSIRGSTTQLILAAARADSRVRVSASGEISVNLAPHVAQPA